ncbi:MAG TPA: hypothetical protein ENK93_03830 [Campylobacteraceae bacterium]|nr:hypothetical protein [Campylobacteraceae bacterium]
MDDFTKTKLINNLIDLVGYFYESKHKSADPSQVKYLKGFCEGIAHTLVEGGMLEQKEAQKILRGLGKKRTAQPLCEPVVSDAMRDQFASPDPKIEEDLDVPTIFRKKRQKQ